jgi:hypothetical protein
MMIDGLNMFIAGLEAKWCAFTHREHYILMHYRGLVRKGACTCSYYYFSRHYQIAVKIKPLYLTHYAFYLTSNTTRVVQQQ